MEALDSYDFESITKLVVRDLRKHYRRGMNQADLSRELGLSFNIVNRWEKGLRQLYWSDFVLLCSHFEINLSQILKDTTGYAFHGKMEERDLLAKFGENPISQTVFCSILSPSQLHRLRSGESKLSFKKFLQILELTFGRSERFVRSLFSVHLSSDLAHCFLNTKDYIQLNSRDTNFALVRNALNLRPYRELASHSSEFLADLLGLSVDDVEVYLRLLTAAGTIEKTKTHYQTGTHFLDTRSGGKEASRRILNLWLRRMLESSESEGFDQSRINAAHLVYETHFELEKKIFDLTNKYYIDLCNLITSENDKEHESIRVMTIAFFSPLENWKTISDVSP